MTVRTLCGRVSCVMGSARRLRPGHAGSLPHRNAATARPRWGRRTVKFSVYRPAISDIRLTQHHAAAASRRTTTLSPGVQHRPALCPGRPQHAVKANYRPSALPIARLNAPARSPWNSDSAAEDARRGERRVMLRTPRAGRQRARRPGVAAMQDFHQKHSRRRRHSTGLPTRVAADHGALYTSRPSGRRPRTSLLFVTISNAGTRFVTSGQHIIRGTFRVASGDNPDKRRRARDEELKTPSPTRCPQIGQRT